VCTRALRDGRRFDLAFGMEAGGTGAGPDRAPRVPAPAPACALPPPIRSRAHTTPRRARQTRESSYGVRSGRRSMFACTRAHPIHRWIDPWNDHVMSGWGKEGEEGLLFSAARFSMRRLSLPLNRVLAMFERMRGRACRIVLIRLFNPGY
jgi:hypothetical protein